MLLKSSRRLSQLPTFCCRSLTYQVKKPNPTYSYNVPKSTFISSNLTRSYCVVGEKSPINEYWIGTKPGDGLIQGRAATNLQESYITDFIVSNEEATDEELDKFREKLFQVTQGHFNETNIDGKMLQTCLNCNNMNLARIYIRYMRNRRIKYNPSSVCSFIKICYNNRKICTREDLDRIEQFTNYLIARFKVFDQVVGESVIKGLCLNNHWQKCSTILDGMKEYIKPNVATVSAYIACLIENGQLEKAWSAMENAASENITLKSEVFIALTEKTQPNIEQMEKLLKFLQFTNTIVMKSVCDHLISVYSTYSPEKQLNGTYVSIDGAGVCSNCGEKLQNLTIDEEEFAELRDEFLNRVLIRDDIFKNTTPKELKNFFQIVKRNAPFDIVVDGLNVIYMSGKMKSERIYSKLLSDTVRYFVERNQKVLVIGRKHMYNFAKDNLSYVRENSTLFLINDLSEDDPYMIYATFYSGSQSCFVSRDLMRSEKFKLSSEKLAFAFKKWQQSHQIFIEYVNYNTGRVFVKNPIAFEMAAQPSKYGWHIPYHDDSYSGMDVYGVHEQWLCLKK